jgi:hypothetical protein
LSLLREKRASEAREYIPQGRSLQGFLRLDVMNASARSLKVRVLAPEGYNVGETKKDNIAGALPSESDRRL